MTKADKQAATIFLVRHGQASLGADDYDQLSSLGEQQAQRLGAYFANQGLAFDAVYTGSLKRHAQTLHGIDKGMGLSELTAVKPTIHKALNEYDSEAVIRAIHPGPLQKATTPDGYKQHFSLLRRGLASWMQAQSQPAGMPSYADFAGGVANTLAQILASYQKGTCNGHTLVVSSGGPLSSAVAQVLGLDAVAGIELNMRMRNTAVSELLVTPKRLALLTFNVLPHLDDAAGRAMQTYA